MGDVLGASPLGVQEPPPVTAHRDSGARCLVAHSVGDWRDPVLLPPCLRCAVCHQWLRPETFATTACPGAGH